MAESFVQASPDSTGKKIAANVDADANYRQVINLGDGAGVDNFASVSASGAVKVDGSAVTQPVSGTVAVSGGSVAVTGTFWQTTQPVSGTFWQATQPVSLPAGQGVELVDSGGTNKASISAGGAVKVDGSAVTQPVSGTVTANAGTNMSTAALALETGGNLATIAGAVASAKVQTQLVDSAGTNKAAISAAGAVKVDNSAVTQPVSGTFWQTTQPVSGTFWQATQPVSGTVAVSGVSGSVAVTGTFWQATQPVSGTVTAAPAVASALVAPAQTKVSVTNTAVQLASAAYAQGVVVQALSGNSSNPFVVGGSTVSTTNGFQLTPGQSVTLPVSNSNLVYINGTAGDGVCVIGV